MVDLIVVFLAGFLASLVDGALGMGFGPTSSSILLGTGLSPAGISTTVNLAKVATGITAAVAHWRFENIDHRLVRRLAVPGCVGALVGVTVLASVDGDRLKPVLAVLLLVMAARILLRFSKPLRPPAEEELVDGRALRYDARGTAAVAATGGVTNGLVGAWGPVVTPFLLHRGLAPRFAIGSVNTAEVAVAVVASGSLLASVGGGGIDLGVVLAMLSGGVLAAPLAAWVIRFLPARALGVAVAGLLFVTNIRELTSGPDLRGAVRWLAYGAAALACTYAALRPRLGRDPGGRRVALGDRVP
ncbi:MAG TPA: sulfite exporter TauE/SafE family protein [Acidimicrobiales bacterium]|nr:sulfite exporter TauE/SafE family protein [Acidimicrobiales bacterium]